MSRGEYMGIASKATQFASQVQQGAKNSTISILAMALKVFTGFVIGLTFALIGQEMIKYETFMFIFVMVVVWGLIFRLTMKWSLGSILIFDLISVLVALLLRMYILVAP